MPLISSSFPHEFSALRGPTGPPTSYIIFYSNVVDGQMWCPDCRDVEGLVKDAFDGPDKPRCLIAWVGGLKEYLGPLGTADSRWKDPSNSFRHDWGIKSIPTIIRFDKGEEVGRLDETGILDPTKWKAFIKE